jgi:hypothetical protein
METTLSLTCPQCGAEFASAIQVDAPTWPGMKIEKVNIERCLRCGAAGRYAKDDYYFA